MDDIISSVSRDSDPGRDHPSKIPFPRISESRSSMAGNDSGLDVAVAIKHVSENLLQSRERRFAGNLIMGTTFLFRNDPERPSNGIRAVMERCIQSNL